MEVSARRDLICALFIAAVIHALAAAMHISAPLPSEVPPPVHNKDLAISIVSTYRETGEITVENPLQRVVESPAELVQPVPVSVKKPVVKPQVPARKPVPEPKETLRRSEERRRAEENAPEVAPERRFEPVAQPLPTASVKNPEPLQEPVPPQEPVVTMPRYRENPPPPYPAKARRRGYRGVTVLSAEILTDGSVGELKVTTSSGYEILDEAALRAVKTWTFHPALKNREPVSGWVDIPVRFELAGDRK